METLREPSSIDEKFGNWFKKNYPTDTDYDEEYQKKIKAQFWFFFTQYLLQIVFFIGAAIFPWFLFFKDVSEPITIYAGAIHLNDWTLPLLLIGSGCSLIIALVILFNPYLNRKFIRLTNLGFVVLLVPVWTSFMDPRFAPGALGHFQEQASLYLVSILNYTIRAHVGYIFMLLLVLAVGIGFLVSLFWNV